MKEGNTYIIAMAKGDNSKTEAKVYCLDTGKRYGKVAAEMRAKQLNNTHAEELVALDYDKFVAYGLFSE
jgi:hypothetical protein